MKKIIRHFIIDTCCLYLVTLLANGITLENGFSTLLAAGVAITIVSLVAKPIINILLLPINLITFGVFRFVGSALVLYLTTLIVKAFDVKFFEYSGFSSPWLDIPNIYLTGFFAYVAFSFLFSLIASFIYWLIK